MAESLFDILITDLYIDYVVKSPVSQKQRFNLIVHCLMIILHYTHHPGSQRVLVASFNLLAYRFIPSHSPDECFIHYDPGQCIRRHILLKIPTLYHLNSQCFNKIMIGNCKVNSTLNHALVGFDVKEELS